MNQRPSIARRLSLPYVLADNMLDASRIDVVSDAFEEAWRRGEPPDLPVVLTQEGWSPYARDQRLAAELGAIDLEQRWRRSQPMRGVATPPTAQDYALLLFGGDADPLPAWVVAELVVRLAVGEADPLSDLQARYSDCPEVLIALSDHSLTSVGPRAASRVEHAEDRSSCVTQTYAGSLSSFGAGRYKVTRVIGRGGQKRVYLARDVELKRDVVIAVLDRGSMSTGDVDVAYDEARAMARLDEHPHIARIYDIGLQAGETFLVAQYVSGGSVGDLLKELSPRPLGVERALRIASQTCSALAHAHANGILHRDVKPANVFLTPSGDIKLGDFGLAVSLEAARDAGVVAGTAAFMSPEQANGDAVGPHSDLYSLGVMLFQMVTGRLPFEARDWYSMLSQHVNAQPIAPSRCNPAVAPDLDRLILRLLAKRVDERPDDAEEVAVSLDMMSQAASGPLAAARKTRPLGGLGSGFMVGRNAELEALRNGLESAMNGTGCVNVVVGEPGCGKTRLVDELTTYARIRGVTVARAKCLDAKGVTSFWPWVQALRALAEVAPHDGVHERVRRTIDEISSVGEILDQCAPESTVPTTPAIDRTRFRLFDDVSQFLRAVSRDAPLLIGVDDLQWADESSLKLLEFVAQDLEDAAVMLVATKRNKVLGEPADLDRLMAELTRNPNFFRTELTGLSLDEVGDYVESVASFRPPERFLQQIWARTRGNAFFVSEVCKLLASDGVLDTDTDFEAVEIGLPEGVREAIRRRLGSLSRECRATLSLCSILGGVMSLSAVQAISNLDAELFDALDEAIDGHLLSDAESGAELSFTHDLIRETVYRELSPLQRRRLHREAADTLASLRETGEPIPPAEIARHQIAAGPLGDVGQAVAFSIEAGGLALRQLAYEESVRQFERARDLIEASRHDESEHLPTVLMQLAEAKRRAGALTEAAATFFAAADALSDRHGDDRLADVAIGVVETHWALRAPGEQDVVLCDEALSTVDSRSAARRVRLLSAKAKSLRYLGRESEAAATAREAVELARGAADALTLGYALNGLLNVISGPDHAESRLRHADEMLIAVRECRDQEQEFHASIWRMFSLLELGRGDAARQALDEAQRVAGDLHQQFYSHLIEGFRAGEATFLGDLRKAEAHALAAFKLGKRVGAESVEGAFGVQMFTIRREQGRLAEIAWIVQRFLRENRDSGWRPGLALIYSELGRPEQARETIAGVIDDGLSNLPKDGTWSTNVAFIAEVASAVGSENQCDAVLAVLEPYADFALTSAGSAACYGSSARLLGCLARRIGDLSLAEEMFEKALDFDDRLRAPLWLNHTRHEFARMLLRRGARDDHDRAHQLLMDLEKDVATAELPLLCRRLADLRVS